MSGYALWNSLTTYNVNDIVDYDSKLFVSLDNLNTNHVPTTSPTWWAQTGGTGSLSQLNAGAGIRITGGSGSSRTVFTNLESPDGRITFTDGVGTELIIGNTSPATIVGTGEIISSGTNPTGITLTLDTAGSAGTRTNPSSIVTDVYGRVVDIFTGTPPVTSLTAGTGIGVVGTTVSNTGVRTLTAGAGISIAGSSTVSNAGLTSLNVVNAGAGISIGGTSFNPTISNTGVLGVSAGAGIVLSGTANNPVIADTAEAAATTVLSRIYFAGNQSDFPIAANGGTGALNYTLDGAIVNQINNGNTTFPNGVWVLDFSSLLLRWDTPSTTINTLVYSFTDGANTYTPNNPEQRLYRLNYPTGSGDLESVVNNIGQVSFNPNALKALGFDGANTNLLIKNLSPTSKLYLLNIPQIAYASFYPYGY